MNLPIKKYLIITLFITLFSFAYTYMIAVLFAEDYNSINYYIDSGFFASIIGLISVIIALQIDKISNSLIVSTSRAKVFINFFVNLVISVLLFFLLSWLLGIIFRGQFSLSFAFLKEQITIINYILIITLAYHTIAYFTKSITEKNKVLKSNNLELSLALNKYLKRIPSTLNKKTILIPIDKVLFFRIEEGIIFAYLSETQKNALTLTTLNSLENQLNPTVFFRINRSEIVNIDKIQSFEPYFKDRLAIKLIDNKTILHTSNAKSSSFRKWLINPANW